MTLGKKIYTLRTEKGMTQEQLAEYLGVSRQSISKYEYDQSTPELEKIKLLAEIFEVTSDDLINDGIELPKTDTSETISGKQDSISASMDTAADFSDSDIDETENNSSSMQSIIEELMKKTDTLEAQYDHFNKTLKTVPILAVIGIFATTVLLVAIDIYQSSLISALQNNQNTTTYINSSDYSDYEEPLIDQTFSSYDYGVEALGYNKTDNTVDYSVFCKPINYTNDTTISAVLTFENGEIYDGTLSENNGTFSGTVTLPLTADDFRLSLLIDNQGEKQNIEVEDDDPNLWDDDYPLNLLDDLDWLPSVYIASAEETYDKNGITTLSGEMYLRTYKQNEEPNDVDTILPFISDIKVVFRVDDSILYEYTLTKEEMERIQDGLEAYISYQFDRNNERLEKNLTLSIEYNNSLIGKRLRWEFVNPYLSAEESFPAENADNYSNIRSIEGDISEEKAESGYKIMPE